VERKSNIVIKFVGTKWNLCRGRGISVRDKICPFFMALAGSVISSSWQKLKSNSESVVPHLGWILAPCVSYEAAFDGRLQGSVGPIKA
jgi:hypothetical protein